MVFDMNFVWLAIVQLFAFFVQGVTGFGCTVLSAPFHSTMIEPTLTTTIEAGITASRLGSAFATFLTIPTLLYLGIREFKNVAWSDFFRIVLFCAPGIIVGNLIVGGLNETVVRVAIGAVVTFIAVMNIYKHIIAPLVLKKETQEDAPDTPVKKAIRYVALIVGGIVHGAFTIGGPLMTVYTLEAVKDKEKFRNTMTWVWITLNTYNVINHIRAGLYTQEMISATAISLPFAFLGLILGMKVLSKIERITFLRAVYIVLLIIGVDFLTKNVPALITMMNATV